MVYGLVVVVVVVYVYYIGNSSKQVNGYTIMKMA
jgi:hypothetical protein